jgi:hypothetical protein
VDQDVAATGVGGDEAEPLLIVKPLNLPHGHTDARSFPTGGDKATAASGPQPAFIYPCSET